jgi:hypothetical protein
MNKVFSVSDKKHPVTLLSGKWYNIAFTDDITGIKTVAAKVKDGAASLVTQLYFEVPKSGRPTYIKVRFVRHTPSGLDVTANGTYTLPPTLGRMTIVHGTPMATRADTPISVQVYLDRGSARLVERIYKGYE